MNSLLWSRQGSVKLHVVGPINIAIVVHVSAPTIVAIYGTEALLKQCEIAQVDIAVLVNIT